jgi:hypothetical protein
LTPLRTNLGDVVCIVDDGHKFSQSELNCGHYRILDIVNTPQEQLTYLCESQEDSNGVMIKRRIRGLDTTALKSGAWKTRTAATKAQLDLITVMKP